MDGLRTFPPAGFLHVDLDGLWTLAGCYGYPEGDQFENDPVFRVGLPRLLALFDELGLKATFFISGRDLTHAAKREAIARIAAAGHELANHSWSHRIDLDALGDDALDEEIGRTSRELESLTGRKPLGFRSPGYAVSHSVFRACVSAGLRYDGSCLPTPWGWGLRFLAGRLRRQVLRDVQGSGAPIKGQYGHGGPMEPWWVYIQGSYSPMLLRLPLAVSPVLRLPIHASMGMLLGERAVRSGLRRLARRGHPVTWLLHGMDAMGPEDVAGRIPSALARRRPFTIPVQSKLAFLRSVLIEWRSTAQMQLTGEWFTKTFPGQ